MKNLLPKPPSDRDLKKKLEEERRRADELARKQARERTRLARGVVGIRSLLSAGPGGFLK